MQLFKGGGGIQKRYKNKKIDIIYIAYKEGDGFKIEKLEHNITKITFDYKDRTPGGYDFAPDFEKLKKIFKNYELTVRDNFLLKKKILRFFINNFVPSKNLRRKFKQKYNVEKL